MMEHIGTFDKEALTQADSDGPYVATLQQAPFQLSHRLSRLSVASPPLVVVLEAS